VLGNHDYGPHWSRDDVADAITASATDAGIEILRNEIADLNGLQVIGLEDLWSSRFDLRTTLGQFDASQPAIALSHNPDTADYPGWARYKFSSWILSGHTHGGQCKAPFLPPPLLPVKNRRYTSGEFELAGGYRMYINRGVGHLLRVRINARPEVTMFRLQRA
jgi:predicted MPP superfamily phosphohydrolase